MKNKSEPKKMISFEISDTIREKIRTEAYLNKRSISEMIRFIINNYFERKDK